MTVKDASSEVVKVGHTEGCTLECLDGVIDCFCDDLRLRKEGSCNLSAGSVHVITKLFYFFAVWNPFQIVLFCAGLPIGYP